MTAPSPSHRRPPGRYDPPSQVGARLTAVVLGVLFFALVGAIAANLYARFGAEPVRAQVVDFQVRSDSLVRIDLEVTKPAGSTAYCLVRSRGRDGAEVGREVVVVDAAGTPETVVRREHDLATSRRAVTGEAGRCSASPIPLPSRAP